MEYSYRIYTKRDPLGSQFGNIQHTRDLSQEYWLVNQVEIYLRVFCCLAWYSE